MHEWSKQGIKPCNTMKEQSPRMTKNGKEHDEAESDLTKMLLGQMSNINKNAPTKRHSHEPFRKEGHKAQQVL
jgi:hypothetical protein